jgi:hypothetical protein
MTTAKLSRRKRLLFASIMALLTVAVAACLLELGIRVFRPTGDFLWQWDPHIGMRLIPGKHGRSVKPGLFDVAVDVNSAGFRDREHSLDKAPGVRRIALLGDSFVEAIQVPFEQSVTSLLENRLSRAEVMSFGVSGTGTARQYLALRHYALPYRPDIVVLFFFAGNDISDNSGRLQGKPYLPYPAVTPTGKLARQPGGEPLFTPFADQSSRLSAATALLKDSWKSYRFVRELLDKSPEVNRVLFQLKLTSTPPEAVNAPTADQFGFYEIYRSELRPEWAEAWDVTQELILATRKAAVSNGSQFLVVLIPAAWEVYAENWEAVLKRLPAMRDASLDLERPSKRLSAFLSANDVPFVNLLPEFRGAASDSPPLYVKHDAHWTFEGHRLATKVLAENLEGMLARTAGAIPAQ